jgi:hypothetical protein
MKRNLLIVLRTCTIINSASNSTRYISVSKHDLVRVCISSLIESINQVKDHDVKLIVLDDHSSPEAVIDIVNIISHCRFPVEFIPVTDGTGNGHTMSRVYEQVERHCTDLWYHIEDDYLHVPEAINDMIETVDQFEGNTGKLVAINPHDDIWRYTRQIYESFLLLGPYRHYRTVRHTTYTCLASRKLFDRYREVFRTLVDLTIKDAGWVEDQSINQIWNQPDVMLFSPIPGLGFHIMDESGRDPYIDIMSIWNAVPKLWRESNKPNMAIVSIFNKRHADLANLTWYNNKVKYAEKYGYLSVAKTDDFSPDQVHFDKFVHILDVMSKHPNLDWVWWLDNDAMITNFDIEIANMVDDNYHVIMPTDIAALNTGSFLVRNSIQGREWLEFLLSKKHEYRNDTKWFEQQAVIDFYPKFQDIFKVIPQQWLNSYDYRMYNVEGIDLLGQDGQWYENSFVIHWPGLPNEARVKLAQQYQPLIKNTTKEAE